MSMPRESCRRRDMRRLEENLYNFGPGDMLSLAKCINRGVRYTHSLVKESKHIRVLYERGRVSNMVLIWNE